MPWRALLPISPAELSIDKTLRCGQSFRWVRTAADTYSCALAGRLISLRQDSRGLYYRAVRPSSTAPSSSTIPSSAAAQPVPTGPQASQQQPQPPQPPLTPLSSTPAADDTKEEEEEEEGGGEEPALLVGPGRDETAAEAADTEAFLRHYLNLGPHLEGLYGAWAAADANFARRAPRFAGIRVLRQDAWEALVGFICSSNNIIARISQM
ncbi:MAG: hypothetical protein LQ340_001769, partial [Diploschistes diacapsis]